MNLSTQSSANTKFFGCAVSLVASLLLLGTGVSLPASTPSESLPSIFTWLKWNLGEQPSRLESNAQEVRLAIRDPRTGEEVRDKESFNNLGWTVSATKMLVSGHRTGGSTLQAEFTNLPAGKHSVYLRFSGRAREPGESWWHMTKAGIGRFDHLAANPGGALYQDGPAILPRPITMIEGTGGMDESTVYEVRLGTVGSDESPETSVSVWWERYKYSETGKIGAIRIETVPAVMVSETGNDNPDAKAMREAFGQPPLFERDTGPLVKSVSGMIKVRPKSFQGLKPTDLQSRIDIAAAKGEVENRQLLVFAESKEVKQLNWQASDLVGEGGQVIPASALEIAPVGFTRATSPDLKVNGFWPDPILEYMDSTPVAKGDIQPLWLRVTVPRDAVAGNYSGAITLEADGAKLEFPVQLRVWDFSIPKRPALPFAGRVASPYDMETEYRINPGSIYGFDDASAKGEWENWKKLDIAGINLFYVGPHLLDKTTKMPSDDQLADWVKVIGQRLDEARKYGLEDRCFVYLFDEGKPPFWDALRKTAATFRKAFPDLQLMTSTPLPLTGENSVDAIDTWVVRLERYDFDEAAKARNQGKKVWVYVCNSPVKPYPNFFVTMNTGMEHRLLTGFMASSYRIDGVLYWAHRDNWPAAPMGDSVFTDWDIVWDGDGQLYQRGPDGPVPSIRLENIRDGMEDYDYIKLAEKIALGPKPVIGSTDTLKSLQSPGNSLVTDLRNLATDPGTLELARRSLGAFIEQNSQQQESAEPALK